MMKTVYVVSEESYLAHHGIKGQKWGVRHGPPYPINNYYFIKENTTMYRTISGNNAFVNKKYTYVDITDDYTKHSIHTSEGFSSRFDHEVQCKSNKKLKIATLDEYFDAVMQVTGVDKNLYLNKLDKGCKNRGAFLVKNLLPYEYREGMGGNYKIFNAAVDYLKNKGYHGVVDPIDGATDIILENVTIPMSTVIFEPDKNLDIVDVWEM